MDQATFVFHALLPDPSPTDNSVPEGASMVVFDIEHAKKVYSHLTAQVVPTEGALEVTHDLPIPCPDFAKAVQTYYQLMMDNHGSTISPSGPKGALPRNNVFRAEWAIKLDVGTSH